MPTVSIVIPTYNRAHMVGDAIRSVLGQTYSDWELIVVDDGSEDDTNNVVSAFDDPRIKYVFQANKGLPGARNAGIRAGSSPYVAFLDSDDLFLPHKLEHQVAMLARRSALGLVAAGHIEVDAHLHERRTMQPWLGNPTLTLCDLLTSCPFIIPSVLVRREWLERVGLFDENMRFVEDWDLWLRLAHAGCAMDWLKQPVCCYRYHGNNMVRNVPLMKAGLLRALDKFYRQSDLPTETWSLHDLAYSRVYLNVSARAFASGQDEEGRTSLAMATQLDTHLREGHPPRFLNAMASFALQPFSDEPIALLERVIQNLPPEFTLPDWSVRKTRSLFHAVSAFDSYQRQERCATIRHAASALLYDPDWLRNRGLLLIAARSLVAPDLRAGA